MKKLIELNVANEADRLSIASILIKNGYVCSQAKTKDESTGKSTYKLFVYQREAGE